MEVLGVVRLAARQVGYFDNLSRIHLTIKSPEKPVLATMNTANLKRAVKNGTILLVSGSLELPEAEVFATPAAAAVPPVAVAEVKEVAEVEEGLEIKEAAEVEATVEVVEVAEEIVEEEAAEAPEVKAAPKAKAPAAKKAPAKKQPTKK